MTCELISTVNTNGETNGRQAWNTDSANSMMRLLTFFFNLRRPRGRGSWRGPSRRTRRRGSGRRRSCRSSRTLQRTGG